MVQFIISEISLSVGSRSAIVCEGDCSSKSFLYASAKLKQVREFAIIYRNVRKDLILLYSYTASPAAWLRYPSKLRVAGLRLPL